MVSLLRPWAISDRTSRSRSVSSRTFAPACRPLAAGVAEAWALADEEAAARAVKRLLGRADRLGGELVGMDAHPARSRRHQQSHARHPHQHSADGRPVQALAFGR